MCSQQKVFLFQIYVRINADMRKEEEAGKPSTVHQAGMEFFRQMEEGWSCQSNYAISHRACHSATVSSSNYMCYRKASVPIFIYYFHTPLNRSIVLRSKSFYILKDQIFILKDLYFATMLDNIAG